MSSNYTKMTNLAIYASGSGTNAGNIIRYFKNHTEISVKVVLCNNPDAYVIQRAKRLDIPCEVFPNDGLEETMNILNEYEIDYIILAGFLLKIPEKMIEAYRGRIINIHPALIPSQYGGKGMYGMNVHNAVIAAGEKESGITIHLVDEIYDHGENIFQIRCAVNPEDTPEDLASRIHCLEQLYYPRIIESYIKSM
jgi:phosphoribosylglycinamide formyltransferase-1